MIAEYATVRCPGPSLVLRQRPQLNFDVAWIRDENKSYASGMGFGILRDTSKTSMQPFTSLGQGHR